MALALQPRGLNHLLQLCFMIFHGGDFLLRQGLFPISQCLLLRLDLPGESFQFRDALPAAFIPALPCQSKALQLFGQDKALICQSARKLFQLCSARLRFLYCLPWLAGLRQVGARFPGMAGERLELLLLHV